MDDLISRKAAIEVAESHRVERPGFHLNDYEFGVTEAADAIASDLEDLPLVQQWIPCSERLPEEDGSYLVCGRWGSGKIAVGDCEYSTEDGYFQTAWNFDVLAWMPLPEPYKAEERE